MSCYDCKNYLNCLFTDKLYDDTENAVKNGVISHESSKELIGNLYSDLSNRCLLSNIVDQENSSLC